MSSLKWLTVLILSVGFLPGLAQNRTIDSLKTLLEDPGTDRIKILIELEKENNIAGNYEVTLKISSEVIPLALKEGDSLNMVMAYRFKAAALRRMEKLDDALTLIKRINAIAERNNFISERKYLFNSMAIIYSNKAQYDLALDCNFKSLAIREAEGDKSEISITLNNIGVVYSNLKNFDKALEYFNRCLKMKREAEDKYDIERVLLNIGLSEVHLRDYNIAIDHLLEVFSVCGDQCPDDVKMEGKFGMGVAYFNLDKLDESVEYFNASYELAKKGNSLLYQSNNLIYLGRISVELKRNDEADKFLRNAERIANAAGYNQLLIDIYKELFKLYSLRRDNRKEIFYLKKYVSLSDSLISLDLVKNIATIQSRFDERENLKNIKTLEENIVLKNEAIARQQLLNVVLGSAAVLLVIVGILIYRLYALRNKSNKQLDIKVKQRTQQLEEGQTHLQGVLQEQHLFIENIREEMKALTATIRGVNVIGNESFDLERELHLSVHTTTLTRLDALIDRIEKREVRQRIYEIA